MDEQSEKVAEQARKYSGSIGRGLLNEQLAEIIEFSSDAQRRDWFERHETVPFWYERFDKSGLTPLLSSLADSWVEIEENVKRAAVQLDRPSKAASSKLVKAFGMYRFKAWSKEHWTWVQRPALSIVNHETIRAMICIALETPGPHNGFPFELQCGQDVCIDGYDTLLLPPTGGGMAILFWIDLE
ncbi:hypothetical protein LTR78_010414 [Recurvomyces mirabilis]|uniref:Uncharacterized protein n=1 Tax=Recurvomyces mirabilis TaxID=574656 RepID=A0AAE0TPU3_9PEZI|nr:hypothetical protein LTR78_010414 [Recurvomyces mirabilis]KAK5149751.1 hypothetical protein LTS14_010672 [Recurvomyces mirabilis]